MLVNGRSGSEQRIWLDGDGGVQADLLTDTLDELFKEGPGEQATALAQDRLRQRIRAESSKDVFFDVLPITPIGPLYIAVSPRGVLAIAFEESEEKFRALLRKRIGSEPVRSRERVAEAALQLRDYLNGDRTSFDLPLDISALTAFQRKVLLGVAKVPRGEVTTYGDLARRIGRPKSARAVGRALGSNPIPIVLPCHRVLAADGTLGGYSGREGIKTKAKLLRLEGALLNL
jgi:methylated-DNA-[protein]-cysteine S-methyltransferase